ncbi:MAG: DNA adenine methylase [Candidatus Poribacteria bacterium]|nr:DNA adenine methylase [Candidatus Poribacteria bacterium]
MKSPLRYPGGKSRAIKQILPYLPANTLEFREPLVGGGSVFLGVYNLFGTQIKRYWVNDLNHDLYCFWKYARDDIDSLISSISAVKENYPNGRELFTEFTSNREGLSDFERAVRFFVLNRITFSGTVDSGGYSQGAFEKRFTWSSIERVKALSIHLSKVHITHGDYESALFEPGENVLVFLDPPYWRTTASRLYGVRGQLHTSFDHERFAKNMKQCPHKWLITYDDSPEVRELFNFAEIIEWQLQYGMNNYKQETAAKGKELFIKNY